METPESKYCSTCGAQILKQAEICPKCGVRQAASEKKEDKWLVTLLLCLFAGVLGVHRFYTGHTAIGVIQLITLGGCGIWSFIDLILIVTGNYRDAQGNKIKQ